MVIDSWRLQPVFFEVHEGPKGLHATNIEPGDLPEDSLEMAEATEEAVY